MGPRAISRFVKAYFPLSSVRSHVSGLRPVHPLFPATPRIISFSNPAHPNIFPLQTTPTLIEESTTTEIALVVGSNILICAQINGRGGKDRSVRLKLDSLDELVMMARRAPVKSFCFGSRSHTDTGDSFVDRYYNESTGWDVHMSTRAPGGGEELVDTRLVAQIQATLLNVGTPQRIILMTGDGNPNGGRGVSFLSAVTAALNLGWIVEIWSWKASCNRLYKNLVGTTSRFSLHYLDDFRDYITLSDVDSKPKAKPHTKLTSIDKCKVVSRADMLNPNNPNYNPTLASQLSKKPRIPRKTPVLNCSVPEWDLPSSISNISFADICNPNNPHYDCFVAGGHKSSKKKPSNKIKNVTVVNGDLDLLSFFDSIDGGCGVSLPNTSEKDCLCWRKVGDCKAGTCCKFKHGV
ncbi:hypothetical protein TrVE_jg3389 [Triparma verrucosa]|uniref:C3H1-type domain-containing protein n=1 Tax=Triparma verrucosa TaxID=1606542 RepID=A0A9W7B3Q0_9STRA|nr:hypothetical protein TrVE_jg3389 [Triparma verrucosa]